MTLYHPINQIFAFLITHVMFRDVARNSGTVKLNPGPSYCGATVLSVTVYIHYIAFSIFSLYFAK